MSIKLDNPPQKIIENIGQIAQAKMQLRKARENQRLLLQQSIKQHFAPMQRIGSIATRLATAVQKMSETPSIVPTANQQLPTFGGGIDEMYNLSGDEFSE